MQRCKQCDADLADQVLYCKKCGTIQDEISEVSADEIFSLPRKLQEITNELIDAYVTTSIKYLQAVSLMEKEMVRDHLQRDSHDMDSDSNKSETVSEKEEEYQRKMLLLTEENQILRERIDILLGEVDSPSEKDLEMQKESQPGSALDEQKTLAEEAEEDAEEPHTIREGEWVDPVIPLKNTEEIGAEDSTEELSQNEEDMDASEEDIPELDPPEIDDMTAPEVQIETDEEEATVGVVLPSHLRNLDGTEESGSEKPEKTVRPKYCAQCGKPLPEIGLRCTYCGSINEMRE